MAQRKKPETKAQTQWANGTKAPQNVVPQVMLSPNEFDTIIRGLKTGTMAQVNGVRQKSFDTLKRLGVKRDVTKVAKTPAGGSDQIDNMSIFNWMDKIEPVHTRAIKQLIVIDATAVARSG